MIHNQKGISMVQVLVAAAMAGGLALVVTQLTTNMNRGLKNAESNADVLSVVQSIHRLLASPENCTATFAGKNAKNEVAAAPAIKDNSSGTFVDNYKTTTLDPKVKYGQGLLKIKSYKLTDEGDDVEVDTLKTTNLIIGFDKGKNSLMQDANKKIALKVEVDGSGKIVSCIATTNASDNVWKYAANNIDIFYNGGNVGVGTDKPNTPFEIKGATNVLALTNLSLPATDPTLNMYLAFQDVNGSMFGYVGDGSSVAPEIHLMGKNGYGVLLGTYSAADPNTLKGSLKIDSSGHVGIGTTTPDSALHIKGKSGEETFLKVYGDGTKEQGVSIGSSDSDRWSWVHDQTNNILFLYEDHSAESGAKIARLSVLPTGQFIMNAGTAAAPAIGIGDLQTGFYRPNDGGIAIVANGSEKVKIDGAGKVGIHTSAPKSELDVNGNISAKMPGSYGANNVLCYNESGYIDACVSLRKFKTDIQPLDIGIQEIMELEPVSYTMKNSKEKEIGFIAEDAVKIDPRFGQKSTDGKLAGLKYEKLTSLIVKAFQDFYKIFIEDEKRITALEKENRMLKQALCLKDKTFEFCR